MIPLTKLKPKMIFKFVSPMSQFYTIILIVDEITPRGPMISNYELNFSHGVMNLFEYFHKFNTPMDQVKADLKRDGVT